MAECLPDNGRHLRRGHPGRAAELMDHCLVSGRIVQDCGIHRALVGRGHGGGAKRPRSTNGAAYLPDLIILRMYGAHSMKAVLR